MAETRGVARAFRFATSVGLTAFEEPRRDGNGSADRDSSPPNGSKKPHMWQEEYIRILCREREVDVDLEFEIRELYKTNRSSTTSRYVTPRG
jgi:hypothetical protein